MLELGEPIYRFPLPIKGQAVQQASLVYFDSSFGLGHSPDATHNLAGEGFNELGGLRVLPLQLPSPRAPLLGGHEEGLACA